jgi:histone H3/H4
MQATAFYIPEPVFYRWAGLMPWKRPHRWISFLLLVSMLSVGMAMGYSISRQGNGQALTGTDIQLIGVCVGVAVVSCGFARMEYVTRTKAHDLANGQNLIGLVAQDAANKAEKAATEAKRANETLPDRVIQKLNGGVEKAAEKAIEKKLDESAFPTTHEQLEAFIRDVRGVDCQSIADDAARKAVALYRQEDQPRVQT